MYNTVNMFSINTVLSIIVLIIKSEQANKYCIYKFILYRLIKYKYICYDTCKNNNLLSYDN